MGEEEVEVVEGDITGIKLGLREMEKKWGKVVLAEVSWRECVCVCVFVVIFFGTLTRCFSGCGGDWMPTLRKG